MFYIDVTENIKLKLLLEKDAQEFFNLMIKNREHLEKFMPRIIETKNVEDAKNVIRLFGNQLLENNGFRTGIYYKNILVGVIGFKYIDWRNKKTEIMYWIDYEFSRKGIVSNCIVELIQIAFTIFKLNKIIIKSSVLNEASNKIAKKLGFSLEGVSRQDELLSCGYIDANVYSLLKMEWESEQI